MLTHTRNWILAGLVGLLVACGGSGGGDSAPGVEPGPPPPGQPVPPPPGQPGPSAYLEAQVLNANITSAVLNEDNQAVIQFTLSDGNNIAISDLTSGDVRFVISKLERNPQGNFTGTWQAYINAIAEPDDDFVGTVNQLQANYERDDGRHPFGEFTNNGDGSYSYQYATSLTDLPQDILDQADIEGLNLSFNPNLTHRVAIQFDNNENRDKGGWANPIYDWVPQTGATPPGIFTMDIAATANCNRCHDPLMVHGDTRRDVKYCVTCHNPGTTDPDSTNTVDMKVMIHKIHMGANLPSVLADEPYYIVGFMGSVHDYSHVHFPQDIRNCENCHAGSATGTDLKYPDGSDYAVTQTSQGDNWSLYATQAACGSCHDDVDFADHAGGQEDDSKCDSCHMDGGIAGSIQSSHQIPTDEARKQFAAEIVAVTNTAHGEFPQVEFRVFDPTNGDKPYNLHTDPVWTQVASRASRLFIDLAWPTTDYTNTGNDREDASAVQLDALANATLVGDGNYTITSTVAVPGDAANGSGVAAVEGHPGVNLGTEAEPDVQSIAFTNAHQFFSVDEADGKPDDRRTSVELDNCLSCHQTLSLHGSNRTDDVQVCVACHNPRNTDRGVREELAEAGTIPPPTDGKDEESLDFKTMIHGIHAAGKRVNALQIVGFGGRSVHVYDEEEVQYPGNLANCVSCHTDSGYTLPLPDGVLATTTDTGIDHESPIDDTVITPITAVCSSCHDDTEATSHMILQGGNFNTTQEAIDLGEVVETCNVCHGEGRDYDVTEVHDIP